jgi:hypothetical protein
MNFSSCTYSLSSQEDRARQKQVNPIMHGSTESINQSLSQLNSHIIPPNENKQ